MSSEPGAAGLAEVDKVLAQRPHKDDASLSQAIRHLCVFRDQLIADRRSGRAARDDRRLSHLNAVISVVVGMHFPLGETPWDEFKKARDWLAELSSDPDACADASGSRAC